MDIGLCINCSLDMINIDRQLIRKCTSKIKIKNILDTFFMQFYNKDIKKINHTVCIFQEDSLKIKTMVASLPPHTHASNLFYCDHHV